MNGLNGYELFFAGAVIEFLLTVALMATFAGVKRWRVDRGWIIAARYGLDDLDPAIDSTEHSAL